MPYGSWFTYVKEFDELQKTHPNFLLLYYEDLHKVINVDSFNNDVKLFHGLNDEVWIYPTFKRPLIWTGSQVSRNYPEHGNICQKQFLCINQQTSSYFMTCGVLYETVCY